MVYMEKLIVLVGCIVCLFLIVFAFIANKEIKKDTFIDDGISTSYTYADGCDKLISWTYHDHKFHTKIESKDGKYIDSIDSIKEPKINKITDSIFAVTISYGNGLSTLETYVYNLENSKKEKYVGMLTFINDNIVYASGNDVVIQKVFTQQSETISNFTYPPSDINEIPFVSAEYDSESKKLNVTYYYGDKMYCYTDSFDISNFVR